jgi:hypothetical protein
MAISIFFLFSIARYYTVALLERFRQGIKCESRFWTLIQCRKLSQIEQNCMYVIIL